MDNYLRQIGINLFECKKCGQRLPSGIIGLADHWSKCAGKEFHDTIIRQAEKGNLTVDKIEQIKNKIMSNKEIEKVIEERTK